MFPPLARGATLMNMLDMVDDILGNQASKPVPRPFQSSNRTAWDAMEDEKAFKLRLDMPGLSKDEVKVDVEDGNITIKGQKKEGEDEWSSRSTGSYDIKIKLPDNVKIEAIKAEMKHGVLRITAPKMEEIKKKVVVSVN
ncbi:hypothetical protein KP509_10G055600 [Ceratopteris richardii]|nr:hypothetical protein KP509_10G055600 [Ceratopteris richardii]